MEKPNCCHADCSEWVIQAAKGDLAAFDKLVKRFRPGSVILANQILNRKDLADDAVQDSFISAFKALPQLTAPEKFASWLGAIVRHRAKRILAGDRILVVPLDELILHHAPSLTTRGFMHPDSETVLESMKDLSADIQAVLELYYFQEWSVREISEFLDLPATTVKWRLHSGRKELRDALTHSLEKLK